MDSKNVMAVPKRQLLARLRKWEAQEDFKQLIANSQASLDAQTKAGRKSGQQVSTEAVTTAAQEENTHNRPENKACPKLLR